MNISNTVRAVKTNQQPYVVCSRDLESKDVVCSWDDHEVNSLFGFTHQH